MDGENAARLVPALERYRKRHHAVIVINCMPGLMRRTRMGSLDVVRFFGNDSTDKEQGRRGEANKRTFRRVVRLFSAAGSWIGRQARGTGSNGDSRKRRHGHGQYLKLVDKLPNILRFVPTAGRLCDVKNYLYIFCYFLQPTPRNIRAMVLFALKHYVPHGESRKLKIDIPAPEAMPSVAIYHPEAPRLFETFEAYRKWYSRRSPKSKVQSTTAKELPLDAESTIGLLLMRPQVVSKTTKHYDALIHAIEGEGLSVIPAISTLMDNREACQKFFIETSSSPKSRVQSPTSNIQAIDNGQRPTEKQQSRVSQIVSLTGFSFVGGPAMNDSLAASAFLTNLNRPYRSAVSLDTQSIEAW
ncbi:MAG: cobaltochelatase subunit CobN, partial [Terriglobia bacterium]